MGPKFRRKRWYFGQGQGELSIEEIIQIEAEDLAALSRVVGKIAATLPAADQRKIVEMFYGYEEIES